MESAIISSVTFMANLVVINYFFTTPNKQEKSSFIFLIPLIGTSFLTNLLFPEAILPVCNIILQFLAIVILTRLKRIPIQKAFFMIVLLLATMLVSDVLASVILYKLTLFDPTQTLNLFSHMYGSALSIFLNIIFVIIFRLFLFKNNSSSKRIFRISVLIALSSIPLVSVIILCIFSLITVEIIPALNYLWIVIFGIIYMNLCSVYLYFELQSYFKKLFQVQLQNKEFEAEVKTFKEVRKSQAQIQAMNHDLNNRFLVVLSFLENNNISSAKNYLKIALEKNEDTQQQFYTHNYTLNYLLNEKRSQAEKFDSSFNIHVFLPKKINLDNDFIAVLLGNLLDNAINAISRLTKSDEREINLTLKLFNHKLLIELSNSFNPSEVDSRKHRKIQGIGIKNIKTIVEDNGGIYEQRINDNIYTVSIVLLNINIGEDK
jgi:two-component system sensor histidine kinase AgrC